MMKRLFICLISILFLSSCSRVETQNNKYVQFYQSQPHDENLFGWWKLIDQEEYYCFDSENFNYLFALYANVGKIHIQGYGEYWYTSDGYIYVFQKESWKIGIEEYKFEYYLSEDNSIIYTKNPYGEYAPWLKRSEAPEGITYP